ncbi:MAG: sulfite exporter TauE/SafE family protein [Deltaproteobacteria bacterium]|nr:sulfite exporter TauE/SafE family protein [Deltaproteobacteria bacterium]
MTTFLLTLAALLTSTLSAIVGMAGGIIFLGICLFFLPVEVAIPVHAATQLVSNSTRLILFFKHIQWRIWLYFFLPAVAGILFGTQIFQAVDKELLRKGIAVFILLAVFLPRARGGKPWRKEVFVLAGALAGTMGMLVGAVGPVIAPFFLHTQVLKEKLIATKAICQASIHLLKIVAFGIIGFSFQTHASLIGILSLAVMAGTPVGKAILKRVSEEKFVLLYKTALLLVALKLIF